MEPRKFLAILSTSAALIVAGLACISSAASPTPDIAAVVAQTQTAISIEQLLAVTATMQQATPTATATLLPSPQHTLASPAPSETVVNAPPDCTNMAKFENETIPDNTTFPPGEIFVKTWSLRNVGTCTWTPNYSIVFVKGEQMGGTSPAPIGETVDPNGVIQLFLPQTAPRDPGSYQGFWKLRSANGQDFGLGEDAEIAFWVKINVEEGTNSGTSGRNLNLGPPTWIDSFEGQSAAFDLGSDSNTSFDLKNGNLVMTAIEPSGDLWRISSGYFSDFAMEVRFKTQSSCSGKDSYGLIVRAPSQPDSIIDSGYIFAFSCEGKYRLYRMDNGNFNGIANWTAHSGIRAGSNQNNTMLIRVEGDHLKLYANEQLVFEFSDSTYPGGLFGLMIRSDVTPNFIVLVEQITYWTLAQ